MSVLYEEFNLDLVKYSKQYLTCILGLNCSIHLDSPSCPFLDVLVTWTFNGVTETSQVLSFIFVFYGFRTMKVRK